jgi:hypothetical protein
LAAADSKLRLRRTDLGETGVEKASQENDLAALLPSVVAEVCYDHVHKQRRFLRRCARGSRDDRGDVNGDFQGGARVEVGRAVRQWDGDRFAGDDREF